MYGLLNIQRKVKFFSVSDVSEGVYKKVLFYVFIQRDPNIISLFNGGLTCSCKWQLQQKKFTKSGHF
jgi:hypothetical protein